MKHHQHTTSAQVGPTLGEISTWPLALRLLHQRVASYFARPEPRRHALLYLQAILSEIPRKNGWHIAEHARQAHPYGIQRLLSHAVWDEAGVRDALRTALVQTLLPPTSSSTEPDPLFPILVLDESGFPKRGSHSAGVQSQYCGVSGRVENCQVGVFLSYVTALGHGLIDRELYIPQEWCHDAVRRQAAHIPESLGFQTKPELALRMVQRAQAAQLPIRWVVADTVYGHSSDLRLWLEQQGYPYAVAVPSIEVVAVQTRDGCLLSDVATIQQQALRPADWQLLSQSLGTKGERLFAWAILPVVHQGSVDDRHFLVFRRCLDDPSQVTSYLVFAPPATPMQAKVSALGGRWRIEEDFENSKEVGLDHYEVRSYVGWYRHITLVMLTLAFLTSLTLSARRSASALPAAPPPDDGRLSTDLCPLSVPEARRLLARLLFPAPRSVPLILAWSAWRRRHQQRACVCHSRHRLKAG